MKASRRRPTQTARTRPAPAGRRYSCPNPSRHGCGCPSVSSRCYGDIREIREEFQAEILRPGPTQGSRFEAATRVVERYSRWGWTTEEILRRF